jgi:large subunit ribosomal protein L22
MSVVDTQVQQQVKAFAKYLKISPYKLRRVANLVRGHNVRYAQVLLKALPHKGARLIEKVLDSAAANASHNFGLNPDQMIVSELLINEGSHMKRFQPRARGRIYKIIKRTSHISLSLGFGKGRRGGKV